MRRDLARGRTAVGAARTASTVETAHRYDAEVPSCPQCGGENVELARFCSSCGMVLHALADAPEVIKTVTILFCDLIGSTQLGERLDPESLHAVQGRYFDRVAAILRSYG